MPQDGPTITIPLADFNDLMKADAKLAALEAAGVDNWDGYDYAMEILGNEDEE